ncbi:hypothetical protein L1I30_13690 [Gillisia sp. M10.2A]|uniref:Uncharacterized protein n=1 Tax=Gillisia lutea TaxID=2909668 RepID=A0ABS9EIN5_9FLAO|nr:hypothetical protein [Gillisia lutea]MCF4102725.1 hypothetical protein [Gillisia lutea]
MKIEYLEERINEYKASIQIVIEKRILWNLEKKPLILKVLKDAEESYKIGWRVQELKWVHINEAVNITFDTFPPDLIEKTNQIPTYQFIQGGSLIFTQMHNGDINVFVIFPFVENLAHEEDDVVDLGTYPPHSITEKLVVEMIDEFLKEIIKWEVPIIKRKLGFNPQQF